MKNKKILVLPLLIFGLSGGLSLALAPKNDTIAAAVEEATLENEYFIGERITIPKGSFVVDDKKIDANFVVIFPSGIQSANKEITLKETGTYQVVYYAKYNGQTLKDTKEFNVFKPLFDTGYKGSASFSANPKLDGLEAVNIKTIADEKVVYNRQIDLTKLTKNDELISLIVNPDIKGEVEFQTLNIKLTNVDDPDNYLILSTTVNFESLSKETNAFTVCYINNETKKLSNDSVTTGYGLNTYVSFYGTPNGGTPLKNEKLTFSYDYLSKQVWVKDGHGNTGLSLNIKSFQNDYDFDPEKCSLEISTYGQLSLYANYAITAIADHNISFTKLEDYDKPTISVDFDGYEEDNLPNAVIGKAYQIFNAQAFDGTTIAKLTTSVYKNYYSNNPINVSIINNSFIPNEEGKYTIAYFAEDAFGNKMVKTVDVVAKSNSTPISIQSTLSDDDIPQGTKLDVNKFVASGGDGLLAYNIIATNNDEPLEINDGVVMPVKVGKLNVIFVASDYNGQEKEMNIAINVTKSDKPIFITNLENALPDTFIAGYSYTLPKVDACVFDADGVKHSIDVSISCVGGTISNDKLVCQNEGTAEVTFEAVNGSFISSETIARNVKSIKSNGYLDMKKLFVLGENISAGYDSNMYATYTANGTTKMSFINPVLFNNFSIALNFIYSNSTIDSLSLRFEDLQDANKVVLIKLIKSNGSVLMSLNDGQVFATGSDFTGAKELLLSISGRYSLISANSASGFVTTYLSGKEFEGFNNNLVRFSIEFNNAQDDFKLVVRKICNQTLKSDLNADTTTPYASILDDYSGNYALNEKYVTPRIYARDVISPELVDFKMTIKDPSGKPLVIGGKTINNVDVDVYEFDLLQYGTYTISYVAKDQNNKQLSFKFTVNVLDFIAPTIKLASGYVTSSTVGSTIKLAQYEVSDNIDKKDNILVVVKVIDPDGNFVDLSNLSFKASKVGKYEVVYQAYDSFGNIGFARYSINVI